MYCISTLSNQGIEKSQSWSQHTEITGKVSYHFSRNMGWGLQPSPRGKAPGTDKQSLHPTEQLSWGARGLHVRKEQDWSWSPTSAQIHMICLCILHHGRRGLAKSLSIHHLHQSGRRYLFLESVGLYQQTSTYSISLHSPGAHTVLDSLELQHSSTLVLERTQSCTVRGKGSELPASCTLGSKTTHLSRVSPRSQLSKTPHSEFSHALISAVCSGWYSWVCSHLKSPAIRKADS